MTCFGRAAWCAALFCLSSSAVFAFPGGMGGVGGGWAQAQHRPQRERQFQPPRRDNYAPPQQPSQPMQPQGPQGPQRLTPDERRQLRRDLYDAGRDVYPQRRDWRR